MKVSVRFEGTGLQLRLIPEGEAEQRMVGAVLNCQRETETFVPLHQVDASLVRAEVQYEGHPSYQRIEHVVLTVHRQEQP